ncbi:MAG: hypothetical protein WA055_05830 [Candidatus Moraniibacteriota bacterium]
MEINPEKNQSKKETLLEKLAIKITDQVGSPFSIILHSIFFVGIFSLQWFGLNFDKIMLILTTLVSLEAIYLSIFIQMTVNRHAHELSEISEDVEDISEDVEEISKDIDDIQEDVEDLGEEIEKDDAETELEHQNNQNKILHIESILKELLIEIRELKDKK